MKKETLKIVVACGGTGGHIFPGLATAQILHERGHDVTLWLSGRRDVEKHAASGYNGKIFHTAAVPLNARNALQFCAAFFRCRRAMRAARPDVVLAMGSYSSLAPVAAARLCHVPVVLHEANAVAGRAVKFLARFAKQVAISFGEAAKDLPREKTVLTGLPIRTAHLKAAQRETGDGFTVFVTGGSQGAHRVNLLASEAFALLRKKGAGDLRVIHQTGAADEKSIAEFYARHGVDARVSAFIQDMGAAYAAADVVVARAGAATCAELAFCGVPAVFIPLPTATRDHQTLNAKSFSDAGAAVCFRQEETTPEMLAEFLSTLRANPARRDAMRGKARSLATADAGERLADVVVASASLPPCDC